MIKLYSYLILAASLSALSTDMIVPALPELQKSFNADYSLIQISISGFLIIFALSQLVAGVIGDKFGKIRIMSICLIIFIIGSAICYTASNLTSLLLGRMLQATGAGAGPVISKAIAKEAFPPLKLKRALSDISSVSAVIPLVAPLGGALIIEYYNWNVIFLVMMLFSIIIMLLSPKITHANEKVICQNSASFVTKEFICGTILVSLILSSLFCYISISPSIFMHTYGLSAFSYSIIFSFSVLFFIIGNQLSKIEKLSNPWFLFSINAVSMIPFIIFDDVLILCVVGSMVFNMTLGVYYPTANFIALQINGSKTGFAASITGFTQTISAGTISFLSVTVSDNGVGPGTTLGLGSLIIALLSIAVIAIAGNNKK
ncbi:MFS transporter [Escherichia coli]|uniref:MFS transporter n=1 Tax=Escherichia coli TaxID=562 RepID=A0A6L6ZP05_ECOLX|nr:MFS transporter [Escherichia coli]EKK2771263.1 MFS transporter [Escherichia coli]MWL44131.1 MFS transporter [Escherichia coli]MWU50642.1 MFS transporter [Escherichia coli]MWU55507.1 MFS transporter [Escherichia coli]